MASPKERREAHIKGFTDADPDIMNRFGWWNLKDAHAYDRLLAYFDKTEPAVANAIRFGLVPRAWQRHTEVGLGTAKGAETQLYAVGRPESHKPDAVVADLAQKHGDALDALKADDTREES